MNRRIREKIPPHISWNLFVLGTYAYIVNIFSHLFACIPQNIPYTFPQAKSMIETPCFTVTLLSRFFYLLFFFIMIKLFALALVTTLTLASCTMPWSSTPSTPNTPEETTPVVPETTTPSVPEATVTPTPAMEEIVSTGAMDETTTGTTTPTTPTSDVVTPVTSTTSTGAQSE